jgi:hypothetical protein
MTGNSESPGVVTYVVDDIYQHIASLPVGCTISLSMTAVQIYNEKVYDLLADPVPEPIDETNPDYLAAPKKQTVLKLPLQQVDVRESKGHFYCPTASNPDISDRKELEGKDLNARPGNTRNAYATPEL